MSRPMNDIASRSIYLKMCHSSMWMGDVFISFCAISWRTLKRYSSPDVLIEISATYQHEHTKKQTGLTLHITDNGPGIPLHLAERVFDRFYQIESGHERSSSGVGLGLAICRGFIEAHGGRIWAENRTDGKSGAIFHLWFPPMLLRAQERQQEYL